MNIKFNAIIFDLGGVVLNLDYKKTITAFKNLGILNFDDLYTQAQQNHIFDNFETGLMSVNEFRNFLRQHTNNTLTNQQIDFAWNAMLLDLPFERIELLKHLKKTLPIYLYSNTNAIHLKAFKKIIKQSLGDENLLENVFNKTYYSHIIGMRKPNKNGFYHIINDNGLTPEKTLFIDDSIQHIKGAKKVGLQTFWLKDKDISELF